MSKPYHNTTDRSIGSWYVRGRPCPLARPRRGRQVVFPGGPSRGPGMVSDAGLGSRVAGLRDRLPADLRDARGPGFEALPFTPLYMIDDEFAAEIANRTMHGVLHLGWVPDGVGGRHGQLAVLVKPNGLLGRAYLTAIKPFRHVIVYPSAIRRIERQWSARGGDRGGPGREDGAGSAP